MNTTQAAYTVRQRGTGWALYDDPEHGWRWTHPGLATPMPRTDADAMAARMGGVVWVGNRPADATAKRPQRPAMPTGQAAGEPDRKADQLRALMAASDWRGAMALAVKFPRLGEAKQAVERAWQAYSRPDFVRQIRRDPDADIAAGVAALRARYDAPAT